MKRLSAVITALIIIASFTACGQPMIDEGGMESVSASLTADSNTMQVVSSDGTRPVSGTGTAVDKPADNVITGVTKADEAGRINSVYVGFTEQDSLGAELPPAKADIVCGIIARYKIDSFSWDNISDYTIVVNGVYYAYDSGGGIITKDDTHADMFSERDRKEFNEAIGASTTDEPTAAMGTTITDTFVIGKVSGTHLELRKADGSDNGLYAGDYGRLDGADEMSFSAGDWVHIRYDAEIMETWPMQITIREIYPAEVN